MAQVATEYATGEVRHLPPPSWRSFMNCAKITSSVANSARLAMSSTTNLLDSIRTSENGLTLAELLARHPDIARRTAGA